MTKLSFDRQDVCEVSALVVRHLMARACVSTFDALHREAGYDIGGYVANLAEAGIVDWIGGDVAMTVDGVSVAPVLLTEWAATIAERKAEFAAQRAELDAWYAAGDLF